MRDDSTVDIKFNALHLILVLIYAKLAIKLKCSLLWAHEMWNVLCQQIKMWIKLFDKLLGYCIKIANVQSTIRKSWQLVFEVFPLKTSQIAIIQFWMDEDVGFERASIYLLQCNDGNWLKLNFNLNIFNFLPSTLTLKMQETILTWNFLWKSFQIINFSSCCWTNFKVHHKNVSRVSNCFFGQKSWLTYLFTLEGLSFFVKMLYVINFYIWFCTNLNQEN